MNIKQLIKNNFQYFFYFYGYLRYRVFVILLVSFAVGLLDGFGLAMFIPLLQMLTDDGVERDDLGKLEFIPHTLESLGVEFNLVSVLILILFFFLLKGGAKFLQGYLSYVYQLAFMRKIRISNINLLNAFKFKEFVKADSGRIQNTFSGEVNKVNQAYKTYFASLQYGALILTYGLMAVLSNISFATMVVVGGALTNFIFQYLYKKTKQLSKKITVENHYFQGLLIQHVAFFKYLKATGLNSPYGKKLKDNIIRIEKLQLKMGTIASFLSGLREPLTISVVVVVILIQVKFLSADLGTVILSLLFLFRALTFLMALQDQWNRFLAGSGSLENMTNFTQELKRGKERGGKSEFKNFKKEIVLKDVSFNYDEVNILDRINLKISKNETIAFVGESGSGKSTLMNIISGLFPPASGEMLVDSTSIAQIDLNSYRRSIGYIAQDPPIFSDTVFNNVTFWDKKTPENLKKFNEAIQKASLFEFVDNLALQEEEVLGNNGINISGGQKQRLSIARELYKEVDFLFMDEATSALDGETEAAIQKSIDELKGEFTVIMIAHRLATIKNADRIVLLNNGKIEAIGNFKKLSETSAKFREMIRLQGL